MSTLVERRRLVRPAQPSYALRRRVARALTERALRSVPVRALYPDGTVVGAGGADSPVLEVVRPDTLFERLAEHPKIGLGEAYMAGDWRAARGTDLGELLTPFAEDLQNLLPARLMKLRRLVDRPLPHRQRNTLQGSRANIGAHYDLSNDLFAAFLDPTMTYSSALFDTRLPMEAQTLESAQRRKMAAVLDTAAVTGGSRVLEIGTGWGALAVEAARRGAHVTSITLSQEQLDLARDRVAAAGLADRVDLLLRDYREVDGVYDAVVSVEMVEAVGEEFRPTYFATLDRLLAPGGRIGLQAIVMDHDRYLATRRSFGWIQKYIFPGGLIPSEQAIDDTLAGHTDLVVTGRRHFGLHYAETLRRWRASFDDRWEEVHRRGFDETFRRMWEFYLAYCEAGFQAGYLDVVQLRIAKRA